MHDECNKLVVGSIVFGIQYAHYGFPKKPATQKGGKSIFFADNFDYRSPIRNRCHRTGLAKKKVETEGKAGCFPLVCSSSFFFGLSNPDACHVCFREICISGIAVRSMIDKVPTLNAGENYSSRKSSRTYVRNLDAELQTLQKNPFYFLHLFGDRAPSHMTDSRPLIQVAQ